MRWVRAACRTAAEEREVNVLAGVAAVGCDTTIVINYCNIS
jgi:hypothetical protein